MTSQARIDANRRNAQKSTGPKTAEGKERSRLNGLKHGLRSEEVVLPTEDRSQFESHLAAWMDDWKPPTETRRFLVERAASAAWKLRRCMRNETVRESDRIKKAEADWDKSHAKLVDEAIHRIEDEPETSIAFLSSSRVGLNALGGLWIGLIKALDDPEGWSDLVTHHNRLCHLLGITGEGDSEALQAVSDASFGLLLRARPDLIEDGLSPVDDPRAERVRSLLRQVGRSWMQEEYRTRFEALPAYPESRRAHADRKAAEAHPEDAIHHRYEGRLDREVRATINQLMTLQKTGLDLVEDEAPTEPMPAEPEPAPKPHAPSEPNAVPAQGLVEQVDHDPIGAFESASGVVGSVAMVGVPLSNR